MSHAGMLALLAKAGPPPAVCPICRESSFLTPEPLPHVRYFTPRPAWACQGCRWKLRIGYAPTIRLTLDKKARKEAARAFRHARGLWRRSSIGNGTERVDFWRSAWRHAYFRSTDCGRFPGSKEAAAYVLALSGFTPEEVCT